MQFHPAGFSSSCHYAGSLCVPQAECTETEPWYGTRYSRAPLPADWLAAWRGKNEGGAAGAGDDGEEAAALHLPSPNPFIPTQFDLIEVGIGQGRAGQGRAGRGRAGQGRAGQGARGGAGCVWAALSRPRVLASAPERTYAMPLGDPHGSQKNNYRERFSEGTAAAHYPCLPLPPPAPPAGPAGHRTLPGAGQRPGAGLAPPRPLLLHPKGLPLPAPPPGERG